MTRFLLMTAAIVSLSGQALALDEPQPIDKKEPRARSIDYVPDAIVQVIVPPSGETAIILHPDTLKADFSVPQKAWRHSHAGSTLIVAPNPGATTTFAHAIDFLKDGRAIPFTFELVVGGDSGTSVTVADADGKMVPKTDPLAGYSEVKFTFDKADAQAKSKQDAEAKKLAAADFRARRAMIAQNGPPVIRAKAPVTPTRHRCDFLWLGSPSLKPQAACDEGDRTVFLWAGEISVPAIFTIDAAGSEHSVTQGPDPSRPGMIVVPTTSERWLFRSSGKLVTELYNGAYDPLWNDAVPGADAQPRTQQAAWGHRP